MFKALALTLILINLTIVVDSTVYDGHAGGMLAFDGIRPSFARVRSVCSENKFNLTQFTAEVWFNIQFKSGKDSLKVGYGSLFQDEDTQAIFGLGWEKGWSIDYAQSVKSFRMNIHGIPGACNLFMYKPSTVFDVWHHFALVYTGARVLLYANGTEVVNIECESPNSRVDYQVDFVLIGGLHSDRLSSYKTVQTVKGLIDEVRVWTKALSAADIKSRMYRTLTSAETTSLGQSGDLILYESFDSDPVSSDGYTFGDHLGNQMPLILGDGQKGYAPLLAQSSAPIVSLLTTEAKLDRESFIKVVDFHIHVFDSNSNNLLDSNNTNPKSYLTLRSLGTSSVLMFYDHNKTLITSTPFSTTKFYFGIRINQTKLTSVSGITSDIFAYDYTIDGLTSSTKSMTITWPSSTNSAPILGYGGKAIRCDGINDHLFANNFTWKGEGSRAVTIEWWGHVFRGEVREAVMLSVGNNELIGHWCTDNPEGEQTRCEGRFHIHFPWVDSRFQFQYGWSPGVRGLVDFKMTNVFDSFHHFAVTSDGKTDPETSSKTKVYVDGNLLLTKPGGYAPTDGSVLNGLLICNWEYWTKMSHAGMIDELRIWDHVRTEKQIKASMSKILKPNEMGGLKAYYTFDDIFLENGLTIVPDNSGNSNGLVFGGCSSKETLPRNESHSGICRQTSEEGPFSAGESFYPSILDSFATLAGKIDRLSVFSNVSKSIIVLNCSDADANRHIIYQFVTLPSKGNFVTLTNTTLVSDGDEIESNLNVFTQRYSLEIFFNKTVGVGGANYSSFKVKASDGELTSDSVTISIDVLCEPGKYVQNGLCVYCPAGSYTPDWNYEAGCSPCSPGSFSDALGSSSCTICDKLGGQYYQSKVGMSSCDKCLGTVSADRSSCDDLLFKFLVIILPTVFAGLILISLLAIFGWRYRQKRKNLQSLDWVINPDDLFCNTHQLAAQDSTRGSDALSLAFSNFGGDIFYFNNDRVHLQLYFRLDQDSNASLESLQCQKYRNTKGEFLIAISKTIRNEIHELRKACVDENIASFIGASVQYPIFAIAYEYFQKGDLLHLLHGSGSELDMDFKLSLLLDFTAGLKAIHNSSIQYHGRIESSSFVVDSRWRGKVIGHGCPSLRAGIYRKLPLEVVERQTKLEFYA